MIFLICSFVGGSESYNYEDGYDDVVDPRDSYVPSMMFRSYDRCSEISIFGIDSIALLCFLIVIIFLCRNLSKFYD